MRNVECQWKRVHNTKTTQDQLTFQTVITTSTMPIATTTTTTTLQKIVSKPRQLRCSISDPFFSYSFTCSCRPPHQADVKMPNPIAISFCNPIDETFQQHLKAVTKNTQSL